MPFFNSRLGFLSLLALAGSTTANELCPDQPDCLSYGMDFQTGGSYFQNSLSSDNFTFVSQYTGCQDDKAYNLIVDPDGTQHQCSDTPLRPDDTNQMATCPFYKNQLWSGAWSVVIISNNGNCDPIAYQRDFYLEVAPQQTVTYTPTVTATVTTTPVVNVTSTTTDTVISTLPPVTVTMPSTTLKPTTTITPARVTTTKSITLLTLKLTKPTVTVKAVINVVTASCKLPKRQAKADPTASITPTIVHAAAMETAASAKFRRVKRDVLQDKAKFIKERMEYLVNVHQIDRRGIDQQPLTLTEIDTALFVTATSTSTAAATTMYMTTGTETTSTSTPPPVTVYSGRTTLSVVTITAPTPTRTVTRFAIATTWTTKTYTATITVNSKTTPPAVKTSCARAGGVLK